MENEEKKEEQVKAPRTKRRVSLFKRRKKSDIRPFVKEHKNRAYKKLLIRFSLFILCLFLFAAVLFSVKVYVIPAIMHKNVSILNPLGNGYPDDDQILEILHNKAMDITGIEFASDSASVVFLFHGSTRVYLSKEKDIGGQLDMVDAIYRQVTMDGKQANSIDLRYNKPIVKF
jgi:cell division septal protein FtsQ